MNMDELHETWHIDLQVLEISGNCRTFKVTVSPVHIVSGVSMFHHFMFVENCSNTVLPPF